MQSSRVYADNAATSMPKAPGVAEAVAAAITHLGSPGRGAYTEAREGSETLQRCRNSLARLFGLTDSRNVIFTLNATDAINLGIKGVLRARRRQPEVPHVVTTWMDHNSILRPLKELERDGALITRVQVDPASGRVDPDDIRAAMTEQTVLIATQHASNVCGAVQPVAQIADIAHQYGAHVLIDAAQTAGHEPIDMEVLGIDLLAVPGHKGLLGPLGTGALCIRPGVENCLDTTREGGTGSASERDTQPAEMPDRFEAGSHNLPGVAGLAVALEWIESRGLGAIRRHEMQLSEQLIEGFQGLDGFRLLGPLTARDRVAVFGFTVDGISPGDISEHLESEHDILSRSGLHCAPLAHATFGTCPNGATRLSLGVFNTREDVERIIVALRSLCSAGRRRFQAASAC